MAGFHTGFMQDFWFSRGNNVILCGGGGEGVRLENLSCLTCIAIEGPNLESVANFQMK